MINITANGIQVPTFDELYQEWENKMREIFGEDIYISPDSQDGQLINAIVLSQNELYQQFIVMYNNFYPNTANGYYLDKLCAFQGITRREPTVSTCDVLVYGKAGTLVDECVLSDINDKLWTSSNFTIGQNGQVLQTFNSVDYAVYVSTNEIINIISAPNDVTSVTNPEPCNQGIELETDIQLRFRRELNVRSGAVATVDYMINAINQLQNVTRVMIYNNDTNTTDTNGIPGHTICCVVQGGNNEEIGDTIARTKSLGVSTYGDVSVPIVNKLEQTTIIKFNRPIFSTLNINFQLRVLNNFNMEDLQNIVQSITSLVTSFQIGEILLYGKFLASVYSNNEVNFSLTSVTFTKILNGETTIVENDDVPCNYNELITLGEITYATIPN